MSLSLSDTESLRMFLRSLIAIASGWGRQDLGQVRVAFAGGVADVWMADTAVYNAHVFIANSRLGCE